MLSSAQYWVRDTDHLVPRYAVSSQLNIIQLVLLNTLPLEEEGDIK